LKDGKEPKIWKDLLTIGRELRALEPALVGETPAATPTSTAEENIGYFDGQAPAPMLRKAGEDRVLIAANEIPFSTAFTVSGLPSELEGATLHRLYLDDSVTVSDGGFRDGIRQWGVNVYATSRRFEASQSENP